MSHISIRVTDHSLNGAQLHLSCTAYVSDSTSLIGFGVDTDWPAVAAVVNQAVKDAAVAAAADAGFTVGVSDNKVLFGAALGL